MSTIHRVKKYGKKAVRVLRDEGVTTLGIKALTKIQKRHRQTSDNPVVKKKFISLVAREDVIDADWSNNIYEAPYITREPLKVVNWVMSPPSSGGGHQNIFRFISMLDAAGYKNNVYIYSTFDDTTPEQSRKNVEAYCTAKNLTFARFNPHKLAEADVLFATGWETAYPVFNAKVTSRKMYFIQDFEPLFYAMGTDYILAENTYKFGFHAVTAGGWLDHKLSTEYGMTCDHYDFGADTSKYKLLNSGKRKEVFFYARPVTERRGFDLGIMALEIFHQKMPEYTINLAGWDVSEWYIPFPHVDHGVLSIDALPDIYNKCTAALVLSLTNMSLLPLELLACGTIPVVNAGPNNSLVSDNEHIKYSEATPYALAEALIEAVTRADAEAYAIEAANSVYQGGWDQAGAKFIEVVEKAITPRG